MGFGDWKKESVVKQPPPAPEKETPAPKTAARDEGQVVQTTRPGTGQVIAAGKRPAGSISDSTQSRNIRFTAEQWQRITERVTGNLNMAVPGLIEFALNELERRGEDLLIEVKRE